MIVVLSDAEDARAVDGQLWRASEQWLCSAGRERDGVMGGLGGEISWSRQKFFAHGSGKGLTKCDVTAWKEGEGTVIVHIKNQRL